MNVGDTAQPVCAITFDIDWSPDWIIDEVLALCVEANVKTTWFVTHQTPMLDVLRSSGLVELGVHPNRLANSTHGQSDQEVLEHVKTIVPDAVSMRTHGLYQTSAFLRRAAEAGFEVDTSQFLPRTNHISPHRLFWEDGHALWRVPFYWEDDVVMMEGTNDWDIRAEQLYAPGIKIFSFHPFHVVINTQDLRHYEDLKFHMPLPDWTPEFIAQHRMPGPGPRSFLVDLLERESDGGNHVRDFVPELSR